MNHWRVTTGLALWALALAALASWLSGRLGATPPLPPGFAAQLWRYASGSRRQVEFCCATPLVLRAGDPIFVVEGPQQVRQVGEIRAVYTADSPAPQQFVWAVRADALLYPDAPPLDGARLDYYETPTSMAWIVATLLPPEKRAQVAQQLRDTLTEHEGQLLAILRPLIEQSLREGIVVLEEDVRLAIDRHQPELDALGARYQREIFERQLLPLVEQEVWPIVVFHAEPVVTEVGREIWERASLWRFGWRYLYDKSPLPDKAMVQAEWKRFLADDAIPVLERHTADFVAVEQRIVADVVANPRVRDALRESAIQVALDPELQRIAGQVVREAVLDNPRLHEAMNRRWNSPESRRALEAASERLEPAIRRIGDLLFGTPAEGITPEFAQVLRNQILGKDRRWLVVERLPSDQPAAAGGDSTLWIRRGEPPSVNPFVGLGE